VAAAKLVIDTRNATKDLHEYRDRIIKLGAGNNPPRTSHRETDEALVPLIAH
jgi:hypothetical protein